VPDGSWLLAVPHSQRDRQLISARHLTAAKISDGPGEYKDD
jgi:hypothetical protein